MQQAELDQIYIDNLTLVNYRNFGNKTFSFNSKINVISGCNGVGKTNILEAISLFAPGNGFRKAKLDDFKNKFSNDNSSTGWFIKLNLSSDSGVQKFITAKDNNSRRRTISVDLENLSQAEIVKFLNIIWLTPQIDNLLNEEREKRKKFIDRIVFNFFQDHIKNLNLHSKFLKERIKILEYSNDEKWLEKIEWQISELASQIAYARVEIINYLNQIIRDCDKSFPKGTILINSEIEEKILAGLKPNELEEYIRNQYKQKRHIDKSKNTTSFGIQKFDFDCFLDQKNISAKFCSTGEQKSMLIMINLAYAILNQKLLNKKPILLLDEFISHMDSINIKELVMALIDNSSQAFITTTDRDKFSSYQQDSFYYIDLENN
ncbi:MAG: AAA family ATPase [Rickettsiales bacterium]|nr:AAA family ATPase [Rickettsiales bacterium]